MFRSPCNVSCSCCCIKTNQTESKSKKYGRNHGSRSFQDPDRLLITAINVGNIPVTISLMGMKFPKNHIIINPDPSIGTLPKLLMPSEHISVWTKAQSLRDRGLSKFDIAYAIDSSGRMYYNHESSR